MSRTKLGYLIYQDEDQKSFSDKHSYKRSIKAAHKIAKQFANETNTNFMYVSNRDRAKARRLHKQMKVYIVKPNLTGKDC